MQFITRFYNLDDYKSIVGVKIVDDDNEYDSFRLTSRLGELVRKPGGWLLWLFMYSKFMKWLGNKATIRTPK